MAAKHSKTDHTIEPPDTSASIEKTPLLLSTPQYQTIFENTGTALMILGPDMSVLKANHELELLTGFPQDYLEGNNHWSELVHPDDFPRVEANHYARRRSESGAPRNYAIRLITRSGAIRHIWLTVAMIPDTDYSIASLMDITELKETELALRESETRFRDLFENARDPIVTIDLKGNFTAVNRACEEVTGYSRQELIGKPVDMVLDPASIAIIHESIKKKIDTGDPTIYQFDLLTRDGNRISTEMSSCLITHNGYPIGIQGTARDISDRVRAQKALAERELRLRTIMDSTTFAVLLIDQESQTIAHANLAAQAMIGAEESEIIGRDYQDFTAETQPFLAEQPGVLQESFIVNASKEFIPVLKSVVPLTMNSHPFILESMCDISALKQAEESLRESEARYRGLFENAHDFIFHLDMKGRFVSLNQSGERLLGYPVCELIGKSFFDLIAPASKASLSQLVSRQLKSNDGNRIIELSLMDKNSRHITLEVSTQLLLKRGKPVGIQGIAHDVTEHKELESQLRYASLHDELTGLHNRSYFEEEMRRIDQSRADSVGLMMFDVDGLKLVNDTMGHHSGDRMLIDTAKILKSCFRGGDMVARVGGDEFAALVNNASETVMLDICARIRHAIEDHNLHNSPVPLSLSVGWAVKTNPMITVSSLFSEADNNMYRNKLMHGSRARQMIVQSMIRDLISLDYIRSGHTRRLQQMTLKAGQILRWSDIQLYELRLLSQYHDIGKILISPDLLMKNSHLTPEERTELHKHSEGGYRIAKSIPRLAAISELILKHHEWWDGTGYPLSIHGDEIPLLCRLFNVIEAYEAMTNERPYRKRIMTAPQALRELKRGSGSQFDPSMVAVVERIV